MLIVGITGPSGSGKTTALQALADLGARVIDCDEVYHDLLFRATPMTDELRSRFGDEVFGPDGALDRKALGAVVFSDEQALADLNDITHRHVAAEVERLLAQAEAEGCPAAAVDAIALLESGLGARCRHTVSVTAPEEVRVRRIMARDGVSEGYARLRVRAQKPARFFEQNCTHALRNGGDDPAAFYRDARSFFQTMIYFEEALEDGGNVGGEAEAGGTAEPQEERLGPGGPQSP